MATYRVHKTRDYTVMSNTHLRDKTLSLKAKGLLTLMLSLPEEWDYTIAGLVAICKENETAVKSALNELKAFGYLVVTKLSPAATKSGRFEYQYDIYEKPQCENQSVEKQGKEKQGVENLPVENQGQLSTNKLSTNKSNKDNKKKERKTNSFDAIIAEYTTDEIISDLLKEWLKVRKAKRAAMTDRAIQMNIAKLDKLAIESNMSVEKYLEEVICRGWAAFYPIANYKQDPKQFTKKTEINKTSEYDSFMAELQDMYEG